MRGASAEDVRSDDEDDDEEVDAEGTPARGDGRESRKMR